MASIDTITKLAVFLSNDEFLVSKLGAVSHTQWIWWGKSGSALHGEKRHMRTEEAHSRLNGGPGGIKRDQWAQSQDHYDPLFQLLVSCCLSC